MFITRRIHSLVLALLPLGVGESGPLPALNRPETPGGVTPASSFSVRRCPTAPVTRRVKRVTRVECGSCSNRPGGTS